MGEFDSFILQGVEKLYSYQKEHSMLLYYLPVNRFDVDNWELEIDRL